ncbi:MAG TPA: GTPase, partial [Thermoanaerobaculia bacterium]
MESKRTRVAIIGAAGRDFHNFNTVYRDDPSYEIVAFTAAQIPGIEGRRYPPALAGGLYPEGIPIVAEEALPSLIREKKIDLCVFSYSDVSHEQVMHLASIAVAAGADFGLLGASRTMIPSKVPVIAITAVRTGAGKSQTTRYVSQILRKLGRKVVAIRHPMPYGDLARQATQRFSTYDDLTKHGCTIEEREEYEPHIDNGFVVYAGVDYGAILAMAEKEAEVILWDGGNNDLPFY